MYGNPEFFYEKNGFTCLTASILNFFCITTTTNYLSCKQSLQRFKVAYKKGATLGQSDFLRITYD